jgi:hypothetical protein
MHRFGACNFSLLKKGFICSVNFTWQQGAKSSIPLCYWAIKVIDVNLVC